MRIIIQLEDSDKKVIRDSAINLVESITDSDLSEDQLQEECRKSIINLMQGINLQDKTTEMVDRMMFEVHTEFFKQFNETVRLLNNSINNFNGIFNKGGMDSKS